MSAKVCSTVAGDVVAWFWSVTWAH